MPMTVEHEPTDQETALYEHMNAGEWGQIAPPEPTDDPEADRQALEQYEVDYRHAWARYQDEHEAPEAEREKNTKDKTKERNDRAKAEHDQREREKAEREKPNGAPRTPTGSS